MIARKPGQFVASGGVWINFKGPGRNRVEIETRSDDQRTGIARLSPDIGLIERVSAKVKVFPRDIYIGRRPSDCRRASARCPTDAGRCSLRYTYNESDVGRTPGDYRSLIVRSFFDLNSINSRA
ncbi:hypothetical protein DPMN_133105 [Dreissena polymorpha]|uniref:Uncharacterized protein n=1 Tax=Dreissena polymorpha TaxID=45954 RepID=A0A9D4JCM5_DREPO|nr:hypothetical protein DPMN_133105 [Dreissena polymorpha]